MIRPTALSWPIAALALLATGAAADAKGTRQHRDATYGMSSGHHKGSAGLTSSKPSGGFVSSFGTMSHHKRKSF